MSNRHFHWLFWKVAEGTWSVLQCCNDYDNQISRGAIKKPKQEGKDKDYWREDKHEGENSLSNGLSIFNSFFPSNCPELFTYWIIRSQTINCSIEVHYKFVYNKNL